MTFVIDPRLEADSQLIGLGKLCQIRVMKDARWPWLLLVPEIANAKEIHDLTIIQQQALSVDTANAARVLKAETQCEKINTGALGNIVRQLHIHVIARYEGDPNWPGPIWGFGEKTEYDQQVFNDFCCRLEQAFAQLPEQGSD